MTVLVTESSSPPSDVVEDAQRVSDGTMAKRVRVEDAVDDSWILRIEGPAGEGGDIYRMTEEEFEDMSNTTKELLGGTHTSIELFYGIGPSEGRYLMRIEY
jgi:hypothetical protein